MKLLAYAFAVLKGCIYGSTVFFTGKLTESTDFLDVLALRFLLSFFVMWFLKTTRILKIKVGVKDFFVKNERTPFLKHLFLAALFEPVLYMLFETVGISQTTGVTTAVILSLSPVFSVVSERIFLRESCTLPHMGFLACGMVGAIYIALNTNTSDGKNSVFGILCILTALACSSLFAVFSRKSSKRFSAMEVTYFSCLLGAFSFNAVNIVRHLIAGDLLHYFDPYFSIENMIGFLFLGVMSTIVATSMNNFALSKLQMSTTAAFGGVSTVVTVLIGVFVNHEEIYYYHLIGFALILARMVGVSSIMIMRDRKKRKLAEIGEETNS